MCVRPVMIKGKLLPCGTCFECQMKKRSEWAYRLQIENRFHTNAYFLTLTYDDEHITELDFDSKAGLYVPNKRHYQLFLKRLRKYATVRYFGCHEYGSDTLRPHYHVILYFIDEDVLPKKYDMVRLWQFGEMVEIDPLNNARIHYTTKYLNKPFRKYRFNIDDPKVVEKMTKKDYLSFFLFSNTFLFMSTRPAIGSQMLEDKEFCQYVYDYTMAHGTYPLMRLNGATFPLPRYYIKSIFTQEERLKIYEDGLNDPNQKDLREMSELSLDAEEYYKNAQILDDLKLSRVVNDIGLSENI